MALDGAYLHFLIEELRSTIVSSRVEKVHQPSRDEIVLHFRGRSGAHRLLLSAQANSPRMHITHHAPENPASPPMFCMLLRKHLTGSLLTGITQHGLDRVVFLAFDASNEVGDRVRLRLCVEIMAKHSNILLIDADSRIIDAMKRIDFTKSSVRQILPGLPYQLPPAQEKKSLLSAPAKEIASAVFSLKSSLLSSALLKSIQGLSPVVCRELAFRAYGSDMPVSELPESSTPQLEQTLSQLQSLLECGTVQPCMIVDEIHKPVAFSFLPLTQYQGMEIRNFSTLSEILDQFYQERDQIERTRRRAHDLFKLLTTLCERTARKLNIQREELRISADKEMLRIYAELINANLYRLEKGAFFYDVENYYTENQAVRIKADPALTPAQNAQQYYKEYRKADRAQQVLTTLIADGEQELAYFETVLDSLSRAQTHQEISEIRLELEEGGYLRRRSGRNKKQKPLSPMRFQSDDGFWILIGRNNVQNDKLSLKSAAKSDLWLHTKNIPGSHVVISCAGKQPPERTIEQAAVLAATYSKARESRQVPVDYTAVKELKKPVGGRPGKVIYHTNKTLYVNPDTELAQRLRKEE